MVELSEFNQWNITHRRRLEMEFVLLLKSRIYKEMEKCDNLLKIPIALSSSKKFPE